MKRRRYVLSSLVVVAAAFGAAGCGTPSPQKPGTDGANHDDQAHGDASDVARQLAKLSPTDRAAAEQQRTCPVTGEPLGSMGVPVKVQVSGRSVFICCEGCEDALKKEPEKYLKKLP